MMKKNERKKIKQKLPYIRGRFLFLFFFFFFFFEKKKKGNIGRPTNVCFCYVYVN